MGQRANIAVAGRRSIARLSWLVVLVLEPRLALAGDAPEPSPSPSATPIVEVFEQRLYLAPGVQLGASSQEVSIGIGRAVSRREAVSGDLRGRRGPWVAAGLRLGCVAHSGSPAAAIGVFYFSFGGRSWEWFPGGLELAVGGAGNRAGGYGLLQLSSVIGIAGGLEFVARLQWPVGVRVARPEWLPTASVGLRVGLDLAKPRRERVTRVEEGEEISGPRE